MTLWGSFDARLILEITPFLATIIIEISSVGASTKLDHQLNRTAIGDALEDADREDIENAALLSFHFEQSMRYYDFSTIAVFIVFLTKSLQPDVNVQAVSILGVLSICVIIGLRVITRSYFEGRAINKYGNQEIFVIPVGNYPGVHKGTFGILVANIIPIICLVGIDLFL